MRLARGRGKESGRTCLEGLQFRLEEDGLPVGSKGCLAGLAGLLELPICWRDLPVAGLLPEELLECWTSCWIDLPVTGLLEELQES